MQVCTELSDRCTPFHYQFGGLMSDRFQQLKELVDSFDQDFSKFYDKKNKAAGVRVRKHMQELRNLAQEIRGEVQDLKKQWEENG